MPGTCSASAQGAAGVHAPVAGGGSAVEVLAHAEAVHRRRGPVEVAAGEQLHVGAGARQRTRQREVVGRRVGGRVDELHAHRRAILAGTTRVVNTFPPVESSRLVRAVFAAARARHGRRVLRHPVAQDRGPAGAALRAPSRGTSRRTATACATLSRVGFDLSEAAEVSFSVIDSEGEEVRRLVDDRQLAGRHASTASAGTAATTTAAVVPDGVYRLRVVPAQGGAGGRLDQGGAGRHAAAAGSSIASVRAERGRPRAAARGRCASATAGPRNEAPEFRVFRTDDDVPRVGAAVPRRRHAAAASGTGPCAAAASRPTAATRST